MINISKLFNFVALLLLVCTFNSCVDTDFDEPDVRFSISDDQVLSVADVIDFLPGFGSVQLTDDLLGSDELYVSGIVTSDDTEGNFFKAIYFQDETGGLVIEPDQNELNAVYPRGHVVYVKLNNLFLLRDSNVPKLAFAVESGRSVRLPDARVKDFVFAGGEADSMVIPEIVTLSNIANNAAQYFNKLVTIQNVEITQEFLGSTYAIADGVDGPESVNVMVTGCETAEELILRNSGFSSFAGNPLPLGSGSMTCIVNKFSDDVQLFIRDTDDLDLNGDRCDGTTVSGEFPDNELDLAELKDNWLTQGIDKIPEGFIEGIVISADNITNRNLILQSGNAGIILRFGNAHSYQLGQRLKVNVGGYNMSEFNGGNQIDGLTPFVVKDEGMDELPAPVDVTAADLISNIYDYESIRIKISGATLSSTVYSGGIDITDATGTVSTFIQSFASFSEQPAPSGVVDIVGYGSYYNREQIIFNSLTDVTGGSAGGDFPTNELDLGDIRSGFWDLGISQLPEGFVQGVVISADNITNRNLVLQSGSAGIILRFASAHDYQLGQQLKVNVSNRSVSEFNGGTQIDGLTSLDVMEDGNVSLPDPVDATIAEMTSNIYDYESIRVKISGATLGSTTYSGNIDISDGTGSLVTFIQSFASWAGESAPSGAVDIVGYGSYYNTPQIIFNDPSDVTGGMVNPGGDGEVDQDFEGLSDFDPINLEGWDNVTVKGNVPWYSRSFDDNGFAECEAYQADDAEIESWLITPAIDTDDKSILSFESAIAFWQHQGLSVWLSPDFTNIADASWVELTGFTLADSGNENYDMVASGDVDLKTVMSGTVRVGWRYVGTSAANTTKVRLDNISLK